MFQAEYRRFSQFVIKSSMMLKYTLVAILILTKRVLSSETYCYADQADIFCTLRPNTIPLTQNDINSNLSVLTSNPWIINSTIILSGNQTYVPGNSFLNTPTIWIINNGSLIIKNNGYANEIAIAAY